MRNQRFGHVFIYPYKDGEEPFVEKTFTIDKRYIPKHTSKKVALQLQLEKVKTELFGGTKSKGWSLIMFARDHKMEEDLQIHSFEYYRVVIAKDGHWQWDFMDLQKSRSYLARTGLELLWG